VKNVIEGSVRMVNEASLRGSQEREGGGGRKRKTIFPPSRLLLIQINTFGDHACMEISSMEKSKFFMPD
jgi:hypothetical protein